MTSVFLPIYTICFGIIAIVALWRLIDIQRDIATLKQIITRCDRLLLGIKIRGDIDMITDIKKEIRKCIDNEDFETAKKLSDLLKTHSDNIAREIEMLNKTYGTDMSFHFHDTTQNKS